MQEKKRIEFIDLAKGVCILMVIIGHITPIPIPGFQTLRMPLYFILSGLFFKDYGGILQLVLKKTNKILIPFLFFYLLGYLCFYIAEALVPGLIKTDANGILDVFFQRQFFNGPIWFLLALFWANIIFCIISINLTHEWQRLAAVVLIGALGICLSYNDIFVPCNIDSAFTALPFFYFGYILKKTPILFPNKLDKYNLLFAISLYVFTYLISTYFGHPYFGFHANNITGNLPAIYLISISSVMCILFLCKSIGKLPFVSYFGRYSIIPLCTHHLIYRPMKVGLNSIGLENIWFVVCATIIICWILIPICIKYIPYVTAQKDLIKIPLKNQINII